MRCSRSPACSDRRAQRHYASASRGRAVTDPTAEQIDGKGEDAVVTGAAGPNVEHGGGDGADGADGADGGGDRGRKRSRAWLRSIASLALVVAVFGGILPQVADFSEVW